MCAGPTKITQKAKKLQEKESEVKEPDKSLE